MDLGSQVLETALRTMRVLLLFYDCLVLNFKLFSVGKYWWWLIKYGLMDFHWFYWACFQGKNILFSFIETFPSSLLVWGCKLSEFSGLSIQIAPHHHNTRGNIDLLGMVTWWILDKTRHHPITRNLRGFLSTRHHPQICGFIVPVVPPNPVVTLR